MKSDKVYLIRRPAMPHTDSTEYAYSEGGADPSFSQGLGVKLWRTLGHVKNHLSQYVNIYGRGKKVIPENWEVVEYQLVPTGVVRTAREVFDENLQKKKDKELAAKTVQLREEKEQRRKQYEELRKEFDPDRTPGKWKELE